MVVVIRRWWRSLRRSPDLRSEGGLAVTAPRRGGGGGGGAAVVFLDISRIPRHFPRDPLSTTWRRGDCHPAKAQHVGRALSPSPSLDILMSSAGGQRKDGLRIN